MLIALNLGCAAQPDERRSTEWALYKNDMLGLQMNYPSHWDTTAHDPRLVFIAAEINPDSLDRFNENLNLSCFVNNGSSLDDIVALNLKAVHDRYGDTLNLAHSGITNEHGVRIETIYFE